MEKPSHPLRKYRESTTPKTSLEALGRAVGRSKATISRIESGKQPVPDDLIPRFSEITGISPADLRPDLAKTFGLKEAAQ